MSLKFPMAFVAVAVGVAILAAHQTPTFHGGTRTVSIYATVVDRNDRLVPDLTKDDFEVYDNGKKQELTVFKNDMQPMTVVIMIDRSGSMVWPDDHIQSAAEEFIGDLLPADKARLGSFSSAIEIAPPEFTSDHAELLRILHQSPQQAGPTPLWDATSAAMGALAHEHGRRVVLIFSDSKDSPDAEGVHASLPEVIAGAETEEIVVYAIGLAGRLRAPLNVFHAPSRPASFEFQGRGGQGGRGGGGRGGRSGTPTALDPGASATPDPGLKKLTADSGGHYFQLDPGDGFTSTFERIADELHHQYVLAFVTAALDGKVHTLKVRVRRPDATVHTRQSYVATPEK